MHSVDGLPFHMSRHALQRALDMQLEPDTIRKCLEQPQYVYQCRQRPEYDLYYRGDICCSVARDSGVVATILWRDEKHWAKDLKDRPGYEGRQWRGGDAS